MIAPRLAWRESRGNRLRLLILASTVALGVTFLTAFTSFIANVRDALETQAQSLLGADLMLSARQAFGADARKLFSDLGGKQAEEISFTTMALAPKSKKTRLTQVRALSSAFPLYGTVETNPPTAMQAIHQEAGALLEESIFYQLAIEVGDTIKIGEVEFRVLGVLRRISSSNPIWESIAPTILISSSQLDATNLLTFGSRAKYKEYFRFPSGTDVESLLKARAEQLDALRLTSETPEDKRRGIERVSENIYTFLRLTGLLTIFLGAIGVANATQMYLAEKRRTVGILRSLGAREGFPARLYLVQIGSAALLASMLGSSAGILLARYLPKILTRLIPVDVPFAMQPLDIFYSIAVGVVVMLLITQAALSRLGQVSPLAVFRDEIPLKFVGWKIPLTGALCLYAICLLQFRAFSQGSKFFISGVVLSAALILLFELSLWIGRTTFGRWPVFMLRYAFRTLDRLKRESRIVVLVIGSAVLFASSTLMLRHMLLGQISASLSGSRPNMIVFDIQDDELEGLKSMLIERGYPIVDEASVVTMRISAVNGRKSAEILTERNESVPDWTLRREYRSTYRDHVTESEEIVKGTFAGTFEKTGLVPISMEEGLAEKLKIGLGAKILFDVQGITLETEVTSLRKVDWKRLQANFFIVFPAGVLEQAPQVSIVSTRVDTAKERATLQEEIVSRFANISTFDLETSIEVVEEVLQKFSIILRVLSVALCVIALATLTMAVVSSLQRRVREQALLKVLGAGRWQLMGALLLEYALLGLFASVSGVVLAIFVSAVLAKYVFALRFMFSVSSFLLPLALGIGVPMLIAVLGASALFGVRPLILLRSR